MRDCLYRTSCGVDCDECCKDCEFYIPISDYSHLSEPDQWQLTAYRADLNMRSEDYLEMMDEYK